MQKFLGLLLHFYGRGDPTRTGDILVPNQTRYQLRYAPIFLVAAVRLELTIYRV